MKRFGTNKDLVLDNFGRQVRLFEHIQKLGNEVDFLCMDYKKYESRQVKKNSVGYYIEPFRKTSPGKFLKKLNQLLKSKKYDFVVASTSPILGVIGYYYAKKHKVKFVYDLQDAFDVYDEYKIPFVKNADKYVTRKADLVICVSNTLKGRISKFRKMSAVVIQNGIENHLFMKLDKAKCRKDLKLPLEKKIIVYIGHLAKLKGFETMAEAFNIVQKKYPNTILFLSGQIDKGINIKQRNIIYDALPERKNVVKAINSADVAIIPNPVNCFTEYSFPYKLVEYMACEVPIVATEVGDVKILLKNYKGSLCKPDDAKDLAEKITEKFKVCSRIRYKESSSFDWKVLATRLNKILTQRL